MQNRMRSLIRQAIYEKALIMGWIGLLVLGVLSNPLFSSFGRDGGIFLYIGSLILKGKIPYVDVWENKGPLVFYINAFGLFLAHGSRWGVWLLEFLFLFSAACMGYLLIKNLMGSIPALVGTFVWVNAAAMVLQGGNFSEEYSLLFSFMAMLFYLKSLEKPDNHRYTLLIGISLGANILLRPNNISVQVAIVGAYFILAVVSKGWRLFIQRSALIALGAMILFAPMILYFTLHGALREMINVVLVFNYQYSSGGGLSRILDGLVNASSSIGLILVLCGLFGYSMLLPQIFRKEVIDSKLGKFLLILVLGWPMEAVLSSLSGRNYPHYFLGWAPYLGLSCAYVIHVLFRRLSARTEAYIVVWVSVLIAVVLVAKIDVWRDYGTALVRAWTLPGSALEYQDPVASYIDENTSPEDTIFVWGFRPVINFMSNRESPASFLPYPLIHVDTPLTQHWADQFYTQFTTHPPELIINMIEAADRERIPDIDSHVRKQYKIKWKEVVLAHNYMELLDFIDQNYVRVAIVEGTDIYRLTVDAP
jgi:Dolichyl-phosphate-mannose-protein mannosyltransferase